MDGEKLNSHPPSRLFRTRYVGDPVIAPAGGDPRYNRTVNVRLKLIGWRSEKPFGTVSRAGDA